MILATPLNDGHVTDGQGTASVPCAAIARSTAGKGEGAPRRARRQRRCASEQPCPPHHQPRGSMARPPCPTGLPMTLRECYRTDHHKQRIKATINVIASLRSGVACMGITMSRPTIEDRGRINHRGQRSVATSLTSRQTVLNDPGGTPCRVPRSRGHMLVYGRIRDGPEP